jgi:hypothetical protein
LSPYPVGGAVNRAIGGAVIQADPIAVTGTGRERSSPDSAG